jgi:prepilin-type N-terminal cleavage/methylation domain-containing protein
MRASYLKREAGFTLVEVMVAIVVITIGVLGTVALADNANRRTSDTKGREGATALVRELVESARTVPFNNLTQADLETSLAWRPSLADGDAAAGWQIQRRNFVYTVTFTICTVDDVSDGYGTSASHDSSFCSGTQSAGSSTGADKNPIDFRRIVFHLAWKDTTGAQSVEQSALINSTYRGPFPSDISTTPPSPIYTGSKIDFTATTNASAQVVKWYIDGRLQGNANGSGTSWSWTWDLNQGSTACAPAAIPDGTYFVSAVAYDRNGATGGAKAASVVINRCPPAAPTGLQGGRNWGAIEITWAANPESDVIGYEVFQGSTLVCGLTTKLSCRDTDATRVASVLPLTYTVKAYDTGQSGQRASAASLPLTVLPDCGVGVCNHPPNTPDVTYNAGTLSISTPAPQDKDTGDSIDFYRIYRTTGTSPPTGPSDRYDIVDNTGGTVTWSDSSSGSYHYWVTAVDRHYSESDFSAVVP